MVAPRIERKQQIVTPERLQEVKVILAAALERPSAERGAYLDQSCTDMELRQEVESLIAAHEHGSSAFLELPSTENKYVLKPGTTVGRYEIVAALGAGGMGVVYRARDKMLQRDVAIKFLPTGLLIDDDARRRFRKEALALAKLNHANIATVYDVGAQSGVDYLVMEYVPGRSLAEKLKSGPLAVKEVISLGEEIAAALEEAHEHGVIHRDLKPANVVVTLKGHAKVLDFGLAKVLTPTDDVNVTRSAAETKGAVGTLLYMSPEQAEGKIVDSRTDLWSLGVLLYESLAGRAPFQGSGALAVLRAITQDAPKSLRELRPDAPADADRIISKALEKDVTKRYQSASDMVLDLSGVLTRLDAPALPRASRDLTVSRKYAIPGAILILILAVLGVWLYRQSEMRHWAREQAIPGIAELQGKNESVAAFLLLEQAEKYLPGDPQLAQVTEANTRVVSIESSPPGATVEIQDYSFPNGAWLALGTTPITKARIPNGYFRWKVSKQGVGEYLTAPITAKQMNFPLDSQMNAPDGMVWESGGKFSDYISFIGWVRGINLPPFYMDRFEVTNRQYEKFVDSGGYEKPEYWTQKFVQNGRELNWDRAMLLFRDSTGRAGPSTWEGGHYPEGQADYPVLGVSWYEAAAYAAFAGKSLPALYQWFQAAPEEVARYIVDASNFSPSGPASVGAFKGLGPYGTYDMAGNAKEWILNTVGDNLHFIVGGAWNSQTYMYNTPEALSPFDRSATNGFRCVRDISPLPQPAAAPVQPIHRDFSTFKPASDDVFRAYRALYAYDQKPLNVKVEGLVGETADWREEKITFDAAYDGERMAAYLYLPKNVQPPYQTIVFFPSARVEILPPDSHSLGDTQFFDYIVQSGRAVLYPIYQGTYERRVQYVGSGGIELLTQRYKDLARSLDYLQTRPDIDNSKLAYLGVSMGSAYGVTYTALLGDRLKTVVFLDGGYWLNPPEPGGDQADFAPRIKVPALMVNGRYDFSFPVEESQNPLFRMLGTPDANKLHVVMNTPHDVNQQRPELIKNVLAWLDKYLGRVN